MALVEITEAVQDSAGNAVTDAAVYVYLAGTTDLATLQTHEAVFIANPATTYMGRIVDPLDSATPVCVEQGQYDLFVTTPYLPPETRRIQLGLPGDGSGGTAPLVLAQPAVFGSVKLTGDLEGAAGVPLLTGVDPDDSDPSALLRSEGPFVPRYHLRDWWTAADFGAKGLGDDYTAELLLAHRETRNASRPLVIPPGVYGLSQQLTRPGKDDTDLGYLPQRIIGAGKDLTIIETAVTANVHAIGTTGDTSTEHAVIRPLSNVTRGDMTLPIDTTREGGLAPGDVLYLRDDSQVFFGGSAAAQIFVAGEACRVKTVDSTTQVTLQGPLDFDYVAASSTWRKPVQVKGFVLSSLTMRDVAPQAGRKGLSVSSCDGLEITDVRFENYGDDCIALGRTNNFLIRGCEFLNLPNIANPYGINLDVYAQSGRIIGCYQRAGRHMVTTTGSTTDAPPAHILVSSCQGEGCYLAVFDTHPAARAFTFVACRAHNTENNGFQIRGINCAVLSCRAEGCGANGLSLPYGADNCRVRDFEAINCDTGINIVSSNIADIRDVHIAHAWTNGVFVDNDPDFAPMDDLQLRDVSVRGNPSGAAFEFNTTYNAGFVLRDLDAPVATTKIAGTPTPVVQSSVGENDPELLIERGGILAGGSTSAAKVGQSSGYATATSNQSIAGAFWFNKADHEIAGRTLKLRLRLSVINGGTATGQSMVGRMYTAVGTAVGATTLSGGLTAATVTDPGIAGSATTTVTFDPPATAGPYALGLVPGGTTAASSDADVRMRLEKFYI